MRKTLLTLALATLSTPTLANLETFNIDPVHTTAIFGVEHFGLAMLYGRFNKTTGKVSFDRTAKTGNVDVVIDTASIDSNDADKGSRARSRDEHLRSADFFNTAEFPRMTYKSTKVNFNGDNPVSVEGNLTLIGTTKPVTLTVERFKCNTGQAGRKDRCGGNVSAKIKRSDFGMKYGIPAVSDEVVLMIGFEGDKE